jgi:hypothetical protein
MLRLTIIQMVTVFFTMIQAIPKLIATQLCDGYEMIKNKLSQSVISSLNIIKAIIAIN